MMTDRGNNNGMKIFLIIVILLGLWLASCDPGSPGTNDPAASFTKIYDKAEQASYTALDIVQTESDGYIILGRVARTPYLLVVSKDGSFIRDTADGKLADYIDPAANLLALDQAYYFFCNRKTYEKDEKKRPILLKVTENNLEHEEFPVEFKFDPFDSMGAIRPIRATAIGSEGFLLLTTDTNWGDVYLFKTDKQGKGDRYKCYWPHRVCTSWYPHVDHRFHIGGVFNQSIFFQTYRPCQFPDDGDFNCDLDGGDPDGYDPEEFNDTCFKIEIAGFDRAIIKKPFIALEWHTIETGSITFSGARIEDDIINFFIDSKLSFVDEGGFRSVEPEESGKKQSELMASKPVYLMTMTVNGQKTVFFAGSSKDNRIVLYPYGQSTSKLAKKSYFGHTHIYQAAGLIATDDDGLAILGTTFVASRLGRICLIKLSRQELEEMIEQ